MRTTIALLALSIFLFSCSQSNTSQETEENTDSTTVAEPLKKTLWNIPLTTAWQDEAHFIFTVPDDYGIDLMIGSTPSKTDDLLTDTLQGKVLDRAVEPLLNNGCESMRSMQVELGTDPKRGWVRAEDVYTIRKLNIATFTNDGATFNVGLMDPWYRTDDNGTCYFTHLIFLYDDQYLYLIDAEEAEFELRWKKAKHLSVVNMLDNLNLTGEKRGKTWVLTWGEPNVKKELSLVWTGDHVKYQSMNTILQNDVDDLNPDEGVEADAPLQTVTCTLQYAGLGDCFHLEFDCGDFGSAQVDLNEEEAALWHDLTSDENGEVIVNPKYDGKEFEITYKVIIGQGCGDPSLDHSQDEIQRVTGFKLK